MAASLVQYHFGRAISGWQRARRFGTDNLRPCLSQGALDGGLDIPHNEKRLVGYDRSGKKMDAEVLKKYIFGGHVAEYMEEMEEEEPEKYMKHFAKYVEADLSGGDLEDKYAEVSRV